MRSLAWALLLSVCFVTTAGREPARRIIEVSTAEELMAVFREPLENVTVQLSPGRYVLTRMEGHVPIRALCGDSEQLRDVTFGLVITGRDVKVAGPVDGEAVIVTSADYRLHFTECADCELERVTLVSEAPDGPVPGGDGSAVLATNSQVRVRNCRIDNTALAAETPPRSAAGIVGAHAVLDIGFNEVRGSYIAIGLYEGAEATIQNNLIEGRRAAGVSVGLGLSMNCDSRATVERNHFRGLGDGIQLSGKSSLELRANIIEDVHDNGLASSHYGLGRVLIDKNVIYGCGGVGIGMRVDGNQRALHNFIVATGRAKPRPGAIWVIGERADAAIRKNTLYDNVVLDESLDRDVPRELFWRARRQWTRTYRNTPVGVDGRHKFHESAFLTRYGRWMD